MKKIRTLKPDEIELRVSHVKDGVANHLLFICSRAATNLLDETYGMENWNLEYKEVNNTIYGRLSIWDEEHGRYVYREDTGEEANISKDKSLASDILKRLIVRFGVSELYTSPRIKIPDDGYGNSGYRVSEINYNDNRQITHLVILDRFNKEVFRWDKDQVPIKPLSNPQPMKQLKDDCTIYAPLDESLIWVDNSEKLHIENLQKQSHAPTPMDVLTNWYNALPSHDSSIKRFYNYYKNKVESGKWTGKMDVERLFAQWDSRRTA